jgi:hypothetical protein
MEVLRRRQKRDDECDDSGNYDSRIIQDIIRKFGCRPMYWNSNSKEADDISDFELHPILH